jgi:predicted Rossmann fold flavoprotein
MATDETFDAIVIGGGAAGLMCGLTAGQRGRRVLLLEHTDKVGAKILISGGGRCNFTNLEVLPERFVSANKHFCKSALGQYTQHDFIALVQKHGIAYHEKTLGQLFCDGSARSIVAMLLEECRIGGVDVRTRQTVTEVTRGEQFRIETNAGSFTAPSLVLATGGISIPKMGATRFSYDVAKRFGLRLTETLPGLVPFTAAAHLPGYATGFSSGDDPGASLAGVAVEAVATYGKARFRENILLTHRGMSGPAVLQISSYWRKGETVTFDMAPGVDVAALLAERKRSRPKSSAQTVLAEILPARLAQAVARIHLPSAERGAEIANIPDKALAACAAQINRWQFMPNGTEGFAKAEVTLGGIDTRDLSSKTMAATGVPGLYAIGEAVDVTGWLGGYNFQWAWSSGWCAGQAV